MGTMFGPSPTPGKFRAIFGDVDWAADPRLVEKISTRVAEPKKVSVPSAQPGEAEYKTLKAEQEKNTVVAPAKRKARGSTIMDNPLATKSQGGAGTTYRKKLLGD